MTKILNVRTTEREYYYTDKDFKDKDINMHFGADGRGLSYLKIIDGEFTNYSYWRKAGISQDDISVHNPNWGIYIKIFKTAIENTGFGFGNDTRSQTRITAEIRFLNDKDDVIREDNFDWLAFHYSFSCNSTIKKEGGIRLIK